MLTIEQAENILSEVDPNYTFKLHLGAEIRSLNELSEVLEVITEESFRHHVNEHKNDFARWILDVIKDRELFNQINHLKSRHEIKKRIDERIAMLEKVTKRGRPFYSDELMNIGIKDFAIGVVIGFVLGVVARYIFF